MQLNELSVDARALLYFYIKETELRLTGRISNDMTITYVNWRENTLDNLSIGGVEINNATKKFGGIIKLTDPENSLIAIQKSLKGNVQRGLVRQLLWKFMDELEFDMHINSDIAYNYKWTLVNHIIKR